MRNIPTSISFDELAFGWSETPLEHFAEDFYQKMEYGNWYLHENWMDNKQEMWIASLYGTPVEILDHDLPEGWRFEYDLDDNGDPILTKLFIRRDKEDHLDNFPMDRFEYNVEHKDDD